MKNILYSVLLLLLFTTALNGGYLENKLKKRADSDTISQRNELVIKKFNLSPTKHSIQQKINRKLSTKDELNAIKHPLAIMPIKIDSLGRESQRYVGERAEVAINPQTHRIVSVNPTSTKKANKLKAIDDSNKSKR